MSLNTSHTPDGKGVLIYNGEMILLYCKGVVIQFPGEKDDLLKKSVTGSMYLTSHRTIFISEGNSDKVKSLSMPFHCMNEVKIELPLFGANYLKGYATPQPGGNLHSDICWKITFNKGGCTDYGRALLKAADMARAFRPYDAPPPYQQPQGNVFAPPPEYYMAPNGNMCGFQAPRDVFPDVPPSGSVYIFEEPPPYSGIGETTTISQFPSDSNTNLNYRGPTPSAPPNYENVKNEAGPLPSKSKIE
ncbi:MIP27169p [Strongyloides ratti]|uniref:MIP27169p n=1 Tax=Strongyloides ratti TaxID=34506 RepID=A0A090LRU1_STRRB|nr:MIP27169p [Strongyloides ratti]CEF70917.1 MIP27169p [Strongyloides ratti]